MAVKKGGMDFSVIAFVFVLVSTNMRGNEKKEAIGLRSAKAMGPLQQKRGLTI
jgi:hypothetical protein